MNETMDSLLRRRSIRAFKPDPVDEKLLEQVLLAGKYTASANGMQPWQFTVVQNRELIKWIVGVNIKAMLESGNENAKKRAGTPGYETFYGAPSVIFISGNKESRYYAGDCGAAAQNMAVAAHSLGLGSCIIGLGLMGMTGDNLARLRKELSIKEGYEPVLTLAVGYQDCADPEPAQRRPDIVNFVV